MHESLFPTDLNIPSVPELTPCAQAVFVNDHPAPLTVTQSQPANAVQGSSEAELIVNFCRIWSYVNDS